MNGQWIGRYQGSNVGQIIVNIDELSNRYRGVAYLIDETKGMPSSATLFETKDKERNFSFKAEVLPVDPRTGMANTWESVRPLYPPEVVFPGSANVEGRWDESSLHLSWRTDIGTSGSCILPRPRDPNTSDLQAQVMNWSEFKDYVNSLSDLHHLFRGQSKPWRLRTSFHRHRRADLTRFLNEDIPLLHKNLSARTKHVFNLQAPFENGAFLNLVQHHGYPTPLLDWTYSPYVAAFFAYRNISNAEAERSQPNERVRIFVLDQNKWKTDFNQVQQLLIAGLHVSIMEFLAIDNERMIPQQAASSVTNVDDIEAYVDSKETEGRRYLWAVDLPKSDRRSVMRELQYMGITAGSLFPGLDGACEDLKERRFES